jgi:hypothetical protein
MEIRNAVFPHALASNLKSLKKLDLLGICIQDAVIVRLCAYGCHSAYHLWRV